MIPKSILFWYLSQLPSAIGQNVETSKIWEELLRRQPNTSTGVHMELDPGQPVFVKEVSGNIWKTATVDQPAGEADSYWMRFPDNSILRRPGQWLNLGLNLLISSYRLKHSHGTLKEISAHILQTPSIQWMWSQWCLLHQWGVWHHLQPEIGAAKSGNQPMLKSTVDVSFSLCRICSVLLGLLSFVLNVQTCEHGTMWKIPHL